MIYEFANQAHTIIRATAEGGIVTVYDLGREGWAEALAKDPSPYVAPAAIDPLAQERAVMQCTMLEIRIALGADGCAQLDAIAADANTAWAMREMILRATVIPRVSQDADSLAWALDLTEAEMDDLFKRAMVI